MGKVVYLFYKTDVWHSFDSKELIYIGDDFIDSCSQLVTHREMTNKDVQQLMNYRQTQCSRRDWEWMVEEQHVNDFTN